MNKGLLHEARKLHATVPCYYVSGIATSAPSTATRSPSPVPHGGGWKYGILASPVATGEVASAASR